MLAIISNRKDLLRFLVKCQSTETKRKPDFSMGGSGRHYFQNLGNNLSKLGPGYHDGVALISEWLLLELLLGDSRISVILTLKFILY
jgi:hypothetical protein